MSAIKIFNLNVHGCFSLPKHFRYFDVCNDKTELIIDETAQKVAFKYFDPRERGGIILRLQTIPSTVYHLFITGQVINGDFVTMRVVNTNPEFFLSPELVFKVGNLDSKSVCFRALSSKTHLLIKTNVDCFLDFAPYSFIVHSLEIIPDCIMCKGFIEGPQGVTGPQGFPGEPGKPAPLSVMGVQGVQGAQGEIGPSGPDGGLGSDGPLGSQGGAGALGTPGEASTTEGPPGNPGPIGMFGAIGVLGAQGAGGPGGAMGAAGPAGGAGDPGPAGAPGDMGVGVGPPGPDGNDGTTSVTTNDTFMANWSRGGESPESSTFTWQRTGDVVTMNMTGFTHGPVIIFVAPLQIPTGALPGTVAPGVGQQSYQFIPLNVNGSDDGGFLQIGPNSLIIYKNTGFGSFAQGDVVIVPDLTFTYRI